MSSSLLESVVPEGRTLPVFPYAALGVIELAGSPGVTARKLAEAAKLDGALASRVLEMANSAYFYSGRFPIQTVERACVQLGLSRLVDVLTTTTIERFFRAFVSVKREIRGLFWRRAVTTAIACRMLCEKESERLGTLGYALGLLENVGQLVLMQFRPEETRRVRSAVEAGAPLLESEREVYGFDHTSVSAELFRTWGFPEELIQAADTHHDKDGSTLAHAGELAECYAACYLLRTPIPTYASWTLATPVPDDFVRDGDFDRDMQALLHRALEQLRIRA